MAEHELISLEQFIVNREKHIGARGEFSRLLRDIGLAARFVNQQVSRAGLAGVLGSTGQQNVQGEAVQKLDLLANELFIRTLSQGGQVCAIASEESEDVITLTGDCGDYVVLIDPLDGSSNIDVNVSIGTIFSVYRRHSQGGEAAELTDCLQPGSEQLAAGYVLYGSSTMMVYTTGAGVNGFTLDPAVGEFFLSHPAIHTPERATYYSVNDSAFSTFAPSLQAYLRDIHARNEDKATAMKPRYIGSLVADFHRNLLEGGIFIYPGTVNKPQGKLRLLYEANPMAFLMEQAGGLATNGTQPILQKTPGELHERTPLFIGSKAEMEHAQAFLHGEAERLSS